MITISAIVEATATEWGVTVTDILSDRRQAAMYLARQITLASLPQIGRAMHRDHTTVMHGVRVIEMAVYEDGDLAVRVVHLRDRLYHQYQEAPPCSAA